MENLFVDIFGAATGFGVGFFAVLLYAVALIIGAAQYVLNGIALLMMSKKLNIPHGWMGFIPVADMYLLGKIADAGAVKKVNAKRLLITYVTFFVLLIVYVISAVVMGFTTSMETAAAPMAIGGFILMLLAYMASAICFSVFSYIAYYRICENFGGANSTGWFLGMLLGSLFFSSVVIPVLLLILSFRTPKQGGAIPVYTATESNDTIFQ